MTTFLYGSILFVLKSGEKYFFQSKLLDGRMGRELGALGPQSMGEPVKERTRNNGVKGLKVGADLYPGWVKQD